MFFFLSPVGGAVEQLQVSFLDYIECEPLHVYKIWQRSYHAEGIKWDIELPVVSALYFGGV